MERVVQKTMVVWGRKLNMSLPFGVQEQGPKFGIAHKGRRQTLVEASTWHPGMASTGSLSVVCGSPVFKSAGRSKSSDLLRL